MLNENDVEKVARLARLTLSSQEKQKYAEQLSAILGYFEQIAKIDTKGVEPLVTPSEMQQHLRVDEMQTWTHVEEAMNNAPEKQGHLFKVPPVV